MSYPTKLKLFKAWAKAMEDGATVDKPNYGKTLSGSLKVRSPSGTRRRRIRTSRRHRRKHAKTQD